jgi:hypothetical protein
MEGFTKAELDALFAALEVASLEKDNHPRTKEYWDDWEALKDKLEELP